MLGLMEPGQRAPAPERLRLLQAFINTNDVEEGTDEFATPARLADWAARHDLVSRPLRLSEADRTWAVSVREALRDLIQAQDRSADAVDATAVLDEAARAAGLRLAFEAHGPSLIPTQAGIHGAVGRILAEIPLAMADGDWQRLKVCTNDACRWVFYDASRNRSSRWCSMAICGNRMKARAYRSRARKESPAACSA
jgi:predicted RNA-binding Zn ribbon-like protein